MNYIIEDWKINEEMTLSKHKNNNCIAKTGCTDSNRLLTLAQALHPT